MSLTWTRSEIRDEIRQLAKVKDTSQYTDDELTDRLNDFLVNHFPKYLYVTELSSFFEIDTADDDDGEYALADEMSVIEKPMTVKDSDGKVWPVNFYQDKNEFFTVLHPEDAHDEDAERSRPYDCLLFARVIYLRPKADDVYTFRTAAIKKLASMSSDSSTLADPAWGPAAAYGTAAMIRARGGNIEAAGELYDTFIGLCTEINRPHLIQKTRNARAKPRA